MSKFKPEHVFCFNTSEIDIDEREINFFAERRHPKTRKWLLDDFNRWFMNPGKMRAFVLLGDAGVGKSVMAGVLAQKYAAKGRLAAAFFCFNGDDTRNNPRYLLGTIACQLCKCNDSYNKFVGGEGGIRKFLGNSGIGVKGLFTKLLQEPLAKCSAYCERKLIVIDALDETKYESREDFLDLIQRRFPMLPKWLVFFITSRPEDTVRLRLKEYNPCIKICAGDSENLNFYHQHELDIRLYLEKSVDFSRLPYSAEDVAKKCNGLFLFAYYGERVLKDQLSSGKISQLTDLFPGDIGEFFRENFKRIFDKVGKDLYKKLFGCAVAAPTPLPVSFISYILQRENDLDEKRSSYLDEQDVIDAFSTFLIVRSDQTFAFPHGLIPSWLTDRKKAPARLFVNKNEGGRYLKDIISEVLLAATPNQQGECLPSIESDVLEYCDQIGVRLLCDYCDNDSLKVVFSYLANYQVIARRLKKKGIEIYSIIGDVKCAMGQYGFANEKKEILKEICLFLESESNVHVLLQSPHLLHCCLQEASKTVQENLVPPNRIGATKIEHSWLPFRAGEIPKEIACFAMSHDKKLIAGASGNSLYLFDACTLKHVQGPFAFAEMGGSIHHLKFSPEGEFLFFGRLDKWFSVKEGCVKDFPHFANNNKVCYKWSSFLEESPHIAVQGDLPPTGIHSEFCLVNIFCSWAIYELRQMHSLCGDSVSFYDHERQAFQGINVLHGLLHSNPLYPTLPNEVLNALRSEVVSNRVWNVSQLCQNCSEFEQRNEEKTLELVRQRVLDLYPHIFEFQVWNVESGRPVLEEAFLKCGGPFFLYHVSAAVNCGVKKIHKLLRERSFFIVALVNLMWCLVPSVLDSRRFRTLGQSQVETLEFPEIIRFFLPNFPDAGNAALEILNRIFGKGKSLASDQTVFIFHDEFKSCKVYLARHRLASARLCHSFENVEHYAFLEDSNVLYYTRAQSLEILCIKTGITLRSVTGRSPFFHLSKKQTVYWFVEQCSGTFDLLRHVSKDLRLLLSLLALEKVVHGTIISAAVVFSLLPEFWETVGEEDIGPSVPEKCVIFSQSGSPIAYHLGPKLYICKFFGAFPYLMCEDHYECFRCHLAFSPDNTLLLHYTQSSNDNPRFQVWDVRSKALFETFDFPAVESLLPAVDCCCLSSDNTKLIVCGKFIIEIWEYGRSACRLITRIGNRSFFSNYNEFSHCTISQETNLLACCITDSIALCPMNAPTNQSIRLLPPAHLGKIEFCQFVKGGRYLISYGVDCNLFLWDLNRCEAIAFAKLCQERESIERLCRSCEADKFFFLTSSGRLGVLTLCGLEHSILPKLPTLEVQSGEMMSKESCGQKRELHGLTVTTHATDDLNDAELLEEMNFMCDSDGTSEGSDDCNDIEMLG